MSITFASALAALMQVASGALRGAPPDDACRTPFACVDSLSPHERRDVGLEVAEIARQSWQLY